MEQKGRMVRVCEENALVEERGHDVLISSNAERRLSA